MEVIGALLLLLLTARAFGEIAERLAMPAAVGEMLAGMALLVIAHVAGTHQAGT